MACYKPITGYRSRKVLPSGRREIVFDRQEGFADLPVQLPCGQCIGCRLNRASEWATRCMHEASLWDLNCSLTLTYDDESLPRNGSLVPADTQGFIKRLRSHWELIRHEKGVWSSPLGRDDFGNWIKRRLSFFLCGEYGGEFERAHYHVLLFGVWFPDATPFKKSRTGHQLFRSGTLDKLWPFGHADIGQLTFESAAYAASYVVDKLNGPQGEEAYLRRGRLPPFVRMSLRPAIGFRWFERWADDVFPSDTVIVRGRPRRPPRYYDRLQGRQEAGDALLEEAKKARAVEGLKSLANRSPSRLAVREEVTRARLNLYKKSEHSK